MGRADARGAALTAPYPALQTEVSAYLDAHAEEVDENGHQLVVANTHRPPCPPPSRVPSPEYAFPQPLTKVTIVI
jgi:hypothetical protein